MLHRYRRLFFVAALGLLPLLSPAQSSDQVRQLAKEGSALHDASRYEEADAKYQQALQLDPGSRLVKYLLALNYYQLKRYAETIRLSQELIAADSKASPAMLYQGYGVSLNALNQPAEAVKVYQQGLKVHPHASMLYFNMGTALYKLRKAEEAQEAFRNSARLDPQHPTSPLFLGLVTADAGNRVPAILEMARFLVLAPDNPRAATALQRIDQLMGRGVEQTGEKSITVNINKSVLDASKHDRGEDNFADLDMLLTLTAATDYTEENKDKTPAVRFAEKLSLICKDLGEQTAKRKHKGFAWEFYAPYFAELERVGHGQAFAYLIRSADSADTEVQQWLQQHSSQVADFKAWSAAYVWPKG
jgi:tetratricopeptide (TPR) repeat protein